MEIKKWLTIVAVLAALLLAAERALCRAVLSTSECMQLLGELCPVAAPPLPGAALMVGGDRK